MSEFEPGLYIIVPAILDDKSTGVGPIPRSFSPSCAPATIAQLRGPWAARTTGNNTFTFAGKGPSHLKWIVKNDVLFFCTVGKSDLFIIEPAENNLWVIAIFGRDVCLTADLTAQPQLTFKPADGSKAQLYKFIRVDRDD